MSRKFPLFLSLVFIFHFLPFTFEAIAQTPSPVKEVGASQNPIQNTAAQAGASRAVPGVRCSPSSANRRTGLEQVALGQQEDRSGENSTTGAVEGTVLGGNNEPVENAIINVQPEDTQLVGKMPMARSGTGGRFLVKGVPAGKNFLFAGNPKEGYPDTQYAVFTPKDIALAPVVVAAGKTTSNITLRMPPRGGRITGKIIDAVTGAPVLTARIHFFQASAPERDISTSPTLEAEFEFVAPPIAYKMEVNAPHYKAWKFSHTEGAGIDDVLKVAPGATEQVIVKLVRE